MVVACLAGIATSVSSFFATVTTYVSCLKSTTSTCIWYSILTQLRGYNLAVPITTRVLFGNVSEVVTGNDDFSTGSCRTIITQDVRNRSNLSNVLTMGIKDSVDKRPNVRTKD